MSDRARLVLSLLADAEQTRDRHPTLFAAQARKGRDCRHLAAVVDRYKREKPSMHARPFRDEVEAIDDAGWLETEAREREERFRGRRLRFDAERRKALAEMDILQKIQAAAQRHARLSTVSGSQIASSAPSSENSRLGPGRQQLLEDDPRYRETIAVLHARADRWHDLLDEQEGHGTVASVVTMRGIEKDQKIIRDGVGLSPVGVVERLGSDISGSAETVRRVRERAERCTKTGEQPRIDCRCKVCRSMFRGSSD